MVLNVIVNGNQKMKFQIDQCYAKDADGQTIHLKMFELAVIISHGMNGHDGCHQSTGCNCTMTKNGVDRHFGRR